MLFTLFEVLISAKQPTKSLYNYPDILSTWNTDTYSLEERKNTM